MTEQTLTFDTNGYLTPYDVVTVDWNTAKATFVTNPLRRQLWADYEQFLVMLRELLPLTHKQWIDGSFASQRENPGDVDVIVFVPNTHFSEKVDALKELKNAWFGRIDCYFVETFPPEHHRFDVGRADELTWYYFLRVDRRNRPKGILELTIDYGNQG